MNWLLLDTDVISYGIKKDTRAQLYAPLLINHVDCISFMTVAELEYWAIRDGLGHVKSAELKTKIENMVVIDSRGGMYKIWAEITLECDRRGRRIHCADAWIAATALYYNIPLVTHNRKDYESISGLSVISMNKK